MAKKQSILQTVTNTIGQGTQAIGAQAQGLTSAMLGNIFNNRPPTSFISPLPEKDTLDTPGKLNYVNTNERKMREAEQYHRGIVNKTIPEPTPYPDFEYPEWMANAATPQTMNRDINIQQKKPSSVLSAITNNNQQQNAPTAQGLNDKVLGFLQNMIFPITRAKGIPDAVAASQWAVESGRIMDSPIKNLFGLGPGWQFNTIEDNVNSYAQTVVNILKKKGYDITKMNAKQIMNALQEGNTRYEGHNANPATYVQTVTNTPEWRHFNQ